MPKDFQSTDLLKDFYKEWISIYKEGAIRDVTLSKYKMSLIWVEKLAPNFDYEIYQELNISRLSMTMPRSMSVRRLWIFITS